MPITTTSGNSLIDRITTRYRGNPTLLQAIQDNPSLLAPFGELSPTGRDNARSVIDSMFSSSVYEALDNNLLNNPEFMEAVGRRFDVPPMDDWARARAGVVTARKVDAFTGSPYISRTSNLGNIDFSHTPSMTKGENSLKLDEYRARNNTTIEFDTLKDLKKNYTPQHRASLKQDAEMAREPRQGGEGSTVRSRNRKHIVPWESQNSDQLNIPVDDNRQIRINLNPGDGTPSRFSALKKTADGQGEIISTVSTNKLHTDGRKRLSFIESGFTGGKEAALPRLLLEASKSGVNITDMLHTTKGSKAVTKMLDKLQDNPRLIGEMLENISKKGRAGNLWSMLPGALTGLGAFGALTGDAEAKTQFALDMMDPTGLLSPTPLGGDDSPRGPKLSKSREFEAPDTFQSEDIPTGRSPQSEQPTREGNLPRGWEKYIELEDAAVKEVFGNDPNTVFDGLEKMFRESNKQDMKKSDQTEDDRNFEAIEADQWRKMLKQGKDLNPFFLKRILDGLRPETLRRIVA